MVNLVDIGLLYHIVNDHKGKIMPGTAQISYQTPTIKIIHAKLHSLLKPCLIILRLTNIEYYINTLSSQKRFASLQHAVCHVSLVC